MVGLWVRSYWVDDELLLAAFPSVLWSLGLFRNGRLYFGVTCGAVALALAETAQPFDRPPRPSLAAVQSSKCSARHDFLQIENSCPV